MKFQNTLAFKLFYISIIFIINVELIQKLCLAIADYFGLKNHTNILFGSFFFFYLSFFIILFFCHKDLFNRNRLFKRIPFKFILHKSMYVVLLCFIIALVKNVLKIRIYHSDNLIDSFQLPIVLVLFFVGPLFEELFFRGFIVNYFSSFRNYQIPILKIKFNFPVLVSSIFFSISHINFFDWYSTEELIFTFFYTFIFGLFLGYQFDKHQNIIASSLYHMIGNICMFLFALFFYHFPKIVEYINIIFL